MLNSLPGMEAIQEIDCQYFIRKVRMAVLDITEKNVMEIIREIQKKSYSCVVGPIESYSVRLSGFYHGEARPIFESLIRIKQESKRFHEASLKEIEKMRAEFSRQYSSGGKDYSSGGKGKKGKGKGKGKGDQNNGGRARTPRDAEKTKVCYRYYIS